MALHVVGQQQRQKIGQTLKSQKTHNILPTQASYGVFVVSSLKKNDCVILVPEYLTHWGRVTHICISTQ